MTHESTITTSRKKERRQIRPTDLTTTIPGKKDQRIYNYDSKEEKKKTNRTHGPYNHDSRKEEPMRPTTTTLRKEKKDLF
ncbi:hypothetical protein Glove_51g21 [Diversispora epigaea]|uniref:Uncharacterized protein n=1 Tax=Diversispora epigaea TaxID=1348612 RepID=A0A397JPH1_9GLOM|nr:hypothetical protein Glove_51g21 [Diversispora epigaea]